MYVLTEGTSKKLIWLGIIMLVGGSFIFFWNDYTVNLNSQVDSDKVGQLGDFIGGIVGSLWALAGVILFYVALREQRQDMEINKEVLKTQIKALEKQIEEFELQRKELELTRNVFLDQSKTLKTQQFESTFFNMVNLHHEIVKSIDVDYEIVSVEEQIFHVEGKRKEVKLTSRDCFKLFYSEFKKAYEDKSGSGNEINRINEVYTTFYLTRQSDLGHYFRNLYNILKFIDKRDPENKYFYSNLLRAQLSSDELLMLFYNGLSQFGQIKFKPFIESYHFLQNMPKNTLINKRLHLPLYNESAFGNPDKESSISN